MTGLDENWEAMSRDELIALSRRQSKWLAFEALAGRRGSQLYHETHTLACKVLGRIAELYDPKKDVAPPFQWKRIAPDRPQLELF